MDLQMFTTPDNQEIRAFFENDEPIFVAADVAKALGYRLAGKLTPAQEHMEAGRFEIKEGQASRTDWAGPQMRFTTRGVEWAARKVREWGITNEKEVM